MPSPFPGMDPFLEGYLWQDVHQSLASQFKRQLSPLLRPRYVARLAVYFVGDAMPAGEMGIVYPGVEVVRPRRALHEAQPRWERPATIPPVTPPSLIAPLAAPLQVRLTSVEVRDVAGNRLVTSIELVSSANKREPGLAAYRRKRADLIGAGVHLLEIDLIRRGERPWALADGLLPASAYLALLTQAGQASTEIWSIGLQDALPVLPVPLRPPDPDVPLDLQSALSTIFDESDYQRTIDYAASPPPPGLSEEEDAWLYDLLRRAGLRP